MSFTTRHWNDCYDERYCAGKECGHSCHCKYDDIFQDNLVFRSKL